jgi:serine transporter
MLEKNNQSSNSLNKQDIVWMLSLYGTAVGAGTLFLPINAGLQGIWPLIIMLLLAFPMTYFSHRAFCRLVLSGSAKNNITQVVEEHFGKVASKLITLFYFCAIYPILLIYSVAIRDRSSTTRITCFHPRCRTHDITALWATRYR